MASIGELYATLGLNTQEFRAQAAMAESRLRGISTQMRSGINTAGKYGVAIAGVGAVLAGQFVRQAFEAADEIRTLSRVSGESVKSFQEQAFAVKSVGIEQQKYADILKDVQDRVGDFLSTGGGPMADYFENIAPLIGQTAEEFRGLSGSEALQKYINGLEAANVSQDQMVFYLEAMASDTTNLLPLLRNNGAELERLTGKAREMGIALSEFDLQKMQEAKRSTDLLGAAMDRASIVAVASMSPSIRAVVETLMDELSPAVKDNEQDVVNWATTAGDVVATTADGLNVAITGASNAFASAGTTIAASAAQMMAFIRGDFQQGMLIGDLWAEDQARIWSDLANNSDYTKYRDRLAQIREEMQSRQGVESLGGINVQGALPQPPQSNYGNTKLPGDETASRAEMAAQEFAEEQRVYQEGMQARFEQIQGSLMSERELEMERHGERVEFLEAAAAGRIQIEGDANAELEKEKARHAEAMGNLEQRQGIRIQGLNDRFNNYLMQSTKGTYSQMFGIASSTLADITAAGARENKAMFEINKIAGISNAVISTQQGAAEALKLGWPMGPIAMASILASGATRIATISSTSFGSGGAGGGGVAPSVNGGAVAPPVDDVGRRNGGNQSAGQSVFIDMTGRPENERESVRRLAEQLGDYLDNGGRIGSLTVK